MIKQVTAIGIAIGMATLVLPNMQTANAEQAPHTVLIQQADPEDYARTRIRNGVEVLRPTDEEHTPEQAHFGFDPVQKDVGLVIMMSTGRLDSAAGQFMGEYVEVGNIQGACMPIRIVQDATTPSGITIQPILSGFRYVSQRQSDENRAYHNPEVVALGGGYFALFASWDRNNNTNTDRYVQVVNSNCELQTLTANVQLRENNTSAKIMNKNNDNCSGRQAGGGSSVNRLADGSTNIMAFELCNGNGRDDGWANYLNISCTGGTCNINKMFDVSVIDREERSRGMCEQIDGTLDMSVCCGNEGNSQPQREGVWCAGVDHAAGNVLWKERVAYRGETASGQRTYAMRIKSRAERTVAGALTGNIVIQYNMHRGNNNRKGGYDDKVMMVSAVPTRDGLNLGQKQDITQMVINSQVEMTHATMFQTFTGSIENPQSTWSFLAPNHNGGGGVSASILRVGMDATTRAVKTMPVHAMSGPADGQKYSKCLGDNPNNQGRNYFDCKAVANPFMAAPGPQQGVPVINMCAMTGKVTTPGIPKYKTDLYFEIWTSLNVPAAPDPDPDPDPDSTPTPEPTDPGNKQRWWRSWWLFDR